MLQAAFETTSNVSRKKIYLLNQFQHLGLISCCLQALHVQLGTHCEAVGEVRMQLRDARRSLPYWQTQVERLHLRLQLFELKLFFFHQHPLLLFAG